MSLVTPDSGLLIWMVLIFGILFFVLAKFGFPIITGMVDKRSERINDALEKAREAEQKLSTLSQQQEQMIEQTRQEQARILREASEARAQMITKAREDAREEADKMLEHARTQIAAEKESALRDIRREVAALSVEVAEKILRKDLGSTTEQLALIDRLMDEASSMKKNS